MASYSVALTLGKLHSARLSYWLMLLQELLVEISDRHKEAPAVTYKICGEVLVPGINTIDIAAIFEEHRVCQQLGALGQHQFHEVRPYVGGV